MTVVNSNSSVTNKTNNKEDVFVFPASFGQQRLWFLEQLEPENSAYNEYGAINCQGQLNPVVLEQSLNEIVRRHEVLRTYFTIAKGEPVQVILPSLTLKLPVIDLRSISGTEQEVRVKQIIEQETQQPFNLQQAPLFRFSLLQLTEDQYILILVLHHIIHDGWSMGLIFREIETLYEAFINNQPSPLPELSIQYADFTIYQNNYLQGEVLEKLLNYWQKQLKNLPVLTLPTDRPRTTTETSRGATQTIVLSQELCDAIKKLSQQQGVTLFMTLLAAFKILLYRYTQQQDIAVGTPVAGRNLTQTENLIGFFINNLVLRTNLEGNPSFLELLSQVRKVALGAYAHQDMPFEKLVEVLKPERDLGLPPLFQVMFVLQNNSLPKIKLSEVTLKLKPIEKKTSKFDLTLYMEEISPEGSSSLESNTRLLDKNRSGMVAAFEYNSDLFDSDTIERMSEHFKTLLTGIVANPDRPISELPFLTEAERNLLNKWNQTQKDYPRDQSIHQIFEEQVKRTPDALALVFEAQQLTYRQLNEKANQLAHYLRSFKVDSGVLVGISIDPSVEQVVSLLSVLKAGGVYVPLDPNYPQERLKFMMEDSQVQVVLTQEILLEKTSIEHSHIICLDRDRDAIEQQSTENLAGDPTENDLAYAIYTSGSTGRPKAVLGRIFSTVNRLHWMWEMLPFAADEICCQKTSINFVDHVVETLLPLLKGIPLVIVPNDIRSDIPQLMNFLSDKKITRIVLVPSLLKAMLEYAPEQLTQLRYLRYVFCSGEVLLLNLAQAFQEKISSARLFNLYGSSEVAADVTWFEVNLWQTRQKILQYFQPQVIHNVSNNQVPGFDQKPFTKPDVSPETLAAKFQQSELPLYPLNVDDYYDKLSQEVLPYVIDTGSPTFIGHMTSALPDFMHDMSKLISQLNQNLVKIETSKSLIFLEREALALLHRLVYNFADEFYQENIQQKNRNLGIVTTGGTTANISALLCARNRGLLRDENSQELSQESIYKVLSKKGYEDVVVIGSRLMHYSINKATSILGMGTKNVVYIDSNSDGQLDLDLLVEKIRECRQKNLYIIAMVGIAGTTETGEIDPLVEMGNIAQEFGIHFHVDGAWGGATMFSERHKGKLKGIEKADTITICGHKQLYLPQGISVCLFKDPQMLDFAATTARYQSQRDTYDVGRFTIEGSRSALSLCLHGALHIIGKRGYEILIDDGIEKAQYFSKLISMLEPFELITEPALNIVNYRYIPADLRAKVKQKSLTYDEIERIDQLNTQIQKEQFERGMTFVSKTTLIDADYGKDKQVVVFRTVLSNPNTTTADLHSVLEDQLRIANQIETRSKQKLDALQNISETTIDLGDPDGTALHTEKIHLLLADDPKANLEEALEEYLKKNTVPIGKPIANTQIYILDKYGNLVPPGITGELYVGGEGLAKGYLSQPELTEEKFILNPLTKDRKNQNTEADRLYKTGDLARWLPDGNIEFVGRIDNQVKIRGIRIELEEIESILNTHPEIKQAVVIASEDINSNKRLVAYLVTSNQSLTTIELREFLQQKLPEYMVPSIFVLLETLPLNPNGKIDRKALPEPEIDLTSSSEYLPPQTPTQEILANMFAGVLGITSVGIQDNFFALGGHSLLATQVISRIRQSFATEIPLKTIFESPTVAQLEQNLKQLTQNSTQLDIPTIQPVPRNEQLLPLSWAQERLWFLNQLEGSSATYNMSGALQVSGNLDINVLQLVLSEIVRRHEVLRTSFPTQDGKAIQVIDPDATININIVDLQELEPTERETIVLKEIQKEAVTPFNLEVSPLFRCSLLQLSTTESVLLLTMHHIVSDGWSIGVFIQELSSLYQAFKQGKPSPLPELPIQYADFGIWQKQWLSGSILETQLNYWKQQLGGAPQKLNLPTDYPRPPVMTFKGQNQSFELSSELTEKLKKLTLESGGTLYMTLLTAFKILLFYYSNQEDIVVASPIANRNHNEIVPLIGFFVNTLALRTDLSGNPTFLELLKQLKNNCLQAYQHQDLPFEKLIAELNIQRDTSVAPLNQVVFTFVNTPGLLFKIPELTISEIQTPSQVAKTDLTLFIKENESGLTGIFEYNTDLFKAETIVQIIDNFRKLIETIVVSQEQTISEIIIASNLIGSSRENDRIRQENWSKITRHSNLTKNQLLIWLGHQLYENTPVYNNIMLSSIPTKIVPQYFTKAFESLVNASDALRTVTEKIDNLPQQKVLSNLSNVVEYLDFSETSNPNSELEAWLSERSRQIFDLEHRLFDCVLIKTSEESFYWYLNLHQLIGDGLSFKLMHDSVLMIYQSYLDGKSEPKLNLFQFQDYLNYEKDYQETNRHSQAKSYWEEKLGDNLEPIVFYGNRAIKSTLKIQRIASELGFERSQKIRDIAAKNISSDNNDSAVFNMFLAIFAIYLYRISGKNKFAIGIPLHNRRTKKFKQTIGSFMQEVPIVIEIEENETFISLVKKIKQVIYEAFRYGQYVIKSSPQQPIYNVIFNYHLEKSNYSQGFPTVNQWINTGHGFEDLAIQITDFGESGNLQIEFDFNHDVFDEYFRGVAIEHFFSILDSCLENQEQLVDQCNLLAPTEKQRLLLEFNQTQVDYPQSKFIHQLFEEQVEKTPDAVAVVFEDQQLTYHQLNQKANQLAYHLQSLGVGPEVLVGICVERSVEIVVGLLGILKAGGAYVPLDPNYPTERLSYMLDDSSVEVLLTQQSLLKSLPKHQALIVCLDTDWETIEQQSQENLDLGVGSDNLAYVIYTSGSTGQPKGVLVPHRNLVNAYFAWEKAYQLKTEARKHLQMANFSFDVFGGDLVRALCSGGKLVLCPTKYLLDAEKLYKLMLLQEIDCGEFVPAVVRNLMEYLYETKQDLSFMKVMIVGSDSWYIEEHKQLKDLCHEKTRLINSYGVTEATVDSCYFDNICTQELYEKLVPIGKPFANAQIYILDSYLQPLPIGVPGELHIGGDGLARGYLNRPQLTTKKFILNPFTTLGTRNSERLYKTGDLARYLPDGNIEFLGRIDNQVKVRGFRIELGEIESVLSNHPQIKQTVIICREDIPGNQQLVAYIVPSEPELNSTELRPYLQSKLPEYMIPSAFVLLENLPLTPNGKIDRKALPAPDINLTRSHEYVPPKTETEKHIATVLQEVLQLEKVSIYDNFFELGANSLILVKINSKVQEILSIEIPLIDMFTYPNINTLSKHIAKKADTPEPLPEVPQIGRKQIKSSMKKRRQLRQKN